MKNDKQHKIPDVVTVRKACEMLECSRTEFYVKHFKNLNSFKDRSNYRTLFFLKDVQEYVNQCFGDNQYNIIG